MEFFSSDGRLKPEHVISSQAAILGIFKRWRSIVVSRAGNSTYIKKQDGSPVTETDSAIEAAVQAELDTQFPGLPVFGEESGYPDSLPRVFWMVDPIDGTSSFVEGVPAFTSMAALIQDDETIASIIYNQSLGAAYTARLGQGAFRDGVRLDVATQPLPAYALCKDRFVPQLSQALSATGVRCQDGPSGAGYSFTRVAEGQTAARFNLHGQGYIHDYAPGALLVREAGGDIIEYSDRPYAYASKTFVACHPGISDAIRGLVPLLRSIESQRN